MAASNPNGAMQFWDGGFPFVGVQKATPLDTGGMQFWNNGFPYNDVFPTATGSSLIKTFDGVATASVKTVGGVAIASVKTVNGVANT